MQTHLDNEHPSEWLESLKRRADAAVAKGTGKITAGAPGEEVLAEWKAHGVYVTQRPADEHAILRISIGGGATPVPLNYLVFRGDRGRCVDLLRQALKALEHDSE